MLINGTKKFSEHIENLMQSEKVIGWLVLIMLVNVAILDGFFFWHLAFNFTDSYSNEQLVTIDAISIQLTIFEMVLAVVGIVLAFLSFWGYQKIMSFVSDEIKKSVGNSVTDTVNEVLDSRGYSQAPDPDILSDLKTTDKKEQEDNNDV